MVKAKKMVTQKTLLDKLLLAIVEEWGLKEVKASLERVTITEGIDQPHNKMGLKHDSPRAPSKPNARQQVERAMIRSEQKEILLVLAERFDNKQFLPSVADVREFLILAGERPYGLKDRSEAFRALLEQLIDFSDDQLAELVTKSAHGGPSQLGPISDAIAAAGQRRSHHRQSSDGNEHVEGHDSTPGTKATS